MDAYAIPPRYRIIINNLEHRVYNPALHGLKPKRKMRGLHFIPRPEGRGNK